MGIRVDSANKGLSRGTGPNGSTFTFTWWGRRRSDRNTFGYFLIDSAAGAAMQVRTLVDGESVVLDTTEQGVTGTLVSLVTDTWYFFALTFTGGTAKLQYLASGGSSFAGNVTQTGLAGLGTINDLRFSNNSTDWLDCEVASAKIWSGVALSDGEQLAERLYRNPQSNVGSIYATLQMKSGAVGTDSSGLGNNFTESGSPAFAADPSDILGDSPVGLPVDTDFLLTFTVQR